MAEALPFRDGAFDAALAVLTVHHWTDLDAGLAELRRVALRQVVLTFEPAALGGLWLVRDYLPEIAELDGRRLPSTERVATALAGADRRVDVHELPIPRDMADGMLAAFWARPGVYLDPAIRAGMSIFASMDEATVEAAMARLRSDLDDGTWARRNAELLDQDELENGYRLLVATDRAEVPATTPRATDHRPRDGQDP